MHRNNQSHFQSFPCRVCLQNCTDWQASICCDGCQCWIHANCINMSHSVLLSFVSSDVSYYCKRMCMRPENWQVRYYVHFNLWRHIIFCAMMYIAYLTYKQKNTNKQHSSKIRYPNVTSVSALLHYALML